MKTKTLQDIDLCYMVEVRRLLNIFMTLPHQHHIYIVECTGKISPTESSFKPALSTNLRQLSTSAYRVSDGKENMNIFLICGL